MENCIGLEYKAAIKNNRQIAKNRTHKIRNSSCCDVTTKELADHQTFHCSFTISGFHCCSFSPRIPRTGRRCLQIACLVNPIISPIDDALFTMKWVLVFTRAISMMKKRNFFGTDARLSTSEFAWFCQIPTASETFRVQSPIIFHKACKIQINQLITTNLTLVATYVATMWI